VGGRYVANVCFGGIMAFLVTVCFHLGV
jgi:hypothetical protein